MENHFVHVANEVKKIEEWAEDNRSGYWYDDFLSEINYKIREVEAYAKKHGVPLFLNAKEIADKHYDDAEGYSEEESSYYEEESSYYDESEYDDEDEEEDTDSSWY